MSDPTTRPRISHAAVHHLCTYVYVYTDTHVCVWVCVHIHISTCSYVRPHHSPTDLSRRRASFMYICIYTQMCSHTRVCVGVCTHTPYVPAHMLDPTTRPRISHAGVHHLCIYVYIYTHVYTHVCESVCTHTHISTCSYVRPDHSPTDLSRRRASFITGPI